MAWTAATRGDYVRPSASNASDVTEREWALIAPLLPAAREGGRPRSTCLQRVVNAIFSLLQAGCQWRMLPWDFPPRSTVYGDFRAWIAGGVWARVHDALSCKPGMLTRPSHHDPTSSEEARRRPHRAGPANCRRYWPGLTPAIRRKSRRKAEGSS